MPRNKRPSFLTKQKEQQRRAKAAQKREARRARQKSKTARGHVDAVIAPEHSESSTP